MPRQLSTWTEILQQNLNYWRYHAGDGMQGSSNPIRATYTLTFLEEMIRR